VRLDEKDVRDLVRLVGEVAALPGGHVEKKRHLMEGLSRLVDADAWTWALSCRRHPAMPRTYVSFMNGGFTDQAFAKHLQALEHPDIVAFSVKFHAELAEHNSHITRLREQMADDHLFERANAYQLWKETGIDHSLFSMRPLGQSAGSAVAVYRYHGRPKFTAREARIAHIILTEVPWLHEQGWPEDRGVTVHALSKRQRLTLNLLIIGQSHKQIAERMKISPHTVSGYIKAIYRHFDVHSQAELMRRFYEGDGRDVK
jgi:DNA-binding CsgD family transcriptional regulator